MSDEFAHNQNIYYHALEKYYEEGYEYYELGDGDELWEHADFRVIMSAHSDVFYVAKKVFSIESLKNGIWKPQYILKKQCMGQKISISF